MKFLVNDGHEVNWSVRKYTDWAQGCSYDFDLIVTWLEPDSSEFLLPGQYFILAADKRRQTSP